MVSGAMAPGATPLGAQSSPDDPACHPPAPPPGVRLPSRVQVASAGEPGERMHVTLRFEDDRGAPHVGLMVYMYHTNAAGRYPTLAATTGCFRWHGYLHAYTRTDSTGSITLETVRPGPYPGRADPAHVHVVLQFPGVRGLYVNDLVFSDDERVTPEYRARERGVGGSGITTPRRDRAGVWQVAHTFRVVRP